MDLINDALDLELIILDGADHTVSIVEYADVSDFGSVKILDSVTRRTVYKIVGGMFIFPSRVSACLTHHLKDRIGPQRSVGPQSYTVAILIAVSWQLGRVDTFNETF